MQALALAKKEQRDQELREKILRLKKERKAIILAD
jgi:quinolinate synthase